MRGDFLTNSYQSRFSKFYNKYKIGTLLFLPFGVLFFTFVVLPVGIAMWMSLTNNDMFLKNDFVGIDNYKQLFVYDKIFFLAIKKTLIFAVVTGPIGFFMSLFVAWIINNMKFKSAFALAFYAPSITSGIAMSVVWLWFFSPDKYGLVNNILMNIGIIDNPVLWNQDGSTIMPIVMLIQIWMSMGTGFLVFLAGLQNVSRELYEAGKIDGISNAFQELFYITLPQMKPQLLFGAIMSITASFSVFDIVVAFAGMPSPNYAAHTIVAHLFDYAFIRYEMGYASAVAVILFAITFGLGQLFMKLLSSEGD
jgi:multiple sugar transport system permease protein